MSMQLSDWLTVAGIAVAVALPIGGALIKHMMADERFKGRISEKVENIEGQLGTHDSGIRGELHRQVGLISRLRAVLYYIDRHLKLGIMDHLEGKDE